MMAGIDDCYTSARGCTATLGNFAKATFDAISKTYSYLTPDLRKETVFTKSPYREFTGTDHLVKTTPESPIQSSSYGHHIRDFGLVGLGQLYALEHKVYPQPTEWDNFHKNRA
ncbi:40S ribosomal protein S2 [Microtus ochrogaster]|uniref:40S ribosomal protein S2 n=1 Tax=Microtus ochrogaster TaxID=79684 RepID=A0A8J6KZM0_MICOH|nr:40S ribosomal protein S2 [Microtus ochrogaster]